MDNKTRKGALVFALVLAIFVAGFAVGFAAGWFARGADGTAIDRRAFDEGFGTIERITDAQQSAVIGLAGVSQTVSELSAATDRSLEYAVGVENGIAGARETNRDISRGIERGLALTADSGDRIAELDGIIRELSKRNSLTEGKGE